MALPRDDKLWDELTSIRWKADSSGKVKLEGKDDLRGRLGRSPDRADAVTMCFASDALHHVGGRAITI